MTYCDEHKAFDVQLDNLNERMKIVETQLDDNARVVSRIDGLIKWLSKTYWVMFTAVMGCVVGFMFQMLNR